MEKQKEKKALAIVAVIFGGIGLLLSAIPIINNVGIFFAIIGLIFGIIALIINRKNKKVLTIVATVISILAIAIVLITQSLYSKALDNAGKAVDTAISSDQKKAEDNFKWTLSDYEALKVGDSMTGAGGTNYNDISKFGKPSSSSDSSSGDQSIKDVSFDNMGAKDYKSVNLTFVKQADGSWLLSNKMQSGLK